MKSPWKWQYNEIRQVGKDYSQPEEVEVYDKSHARFRDVVKENDNILDSLGIGTGHLVIDIGAGTGTFAVQAAARGAGVYAVDVSRAMLDYARTRADEAGVSNIEFCRAGFLSLEIESETVDFIITTFAFHHLPDFWKGIALTRMHDMLKAGGKLYIHDVIIEEKDALENIEAVIEKLAETGGDLLKEDAETHFREEFSTYDWIMDGLLSRAGFIIEEKEITDGLMATYVCQKQENP